MVSITYSAYDYAHVPASVLHEACAQECLTVLVYFLCFFQGQDKLSIKVKEGGNAMHDEVQNSLESIPSVPVDAKHDEEKDVSSLVEHSALLLEYIQIVAHAETILFHFRLVLLILLQGKLLQVQ